MFGLDSIMGKIIVMLIFGRIAIFCIKTCYNLRYDVIDLFRINLRGCNFLEAILVLGAFLIQFILFTILFLITSMFTVGTFMVWFP